jgi:hypothetical protein
MTTDLQYTSIEDAMNAKMELIEDIHSIDAQLSERAARVKSQRVPEEEYQQYLVWKSRALRAKSHMVKSLQRTKMWILSRRDQEVRTRHESRGSDYMVLSDLLHLTRVLAARSYVNPDEQLLIDDTAAYLAAGSEVNR